jgi:hypothetical protein
MQAVRPGDQIEASRRAAFEYDTYAIGRIGDRRDTVAENDFTRRFDRAEEQLGKIAARQTEETPPGELAKDICLEASHPLGAVIDEPQLSHVIGAAFESGKKPHSLRDVVTQSPEIDDVPAGSQARRPLDQSRLEALAGEPICEGASSNSGAANEH